MQRRPNAADLSSRAAKGGDVDYVVTHVTRFQYQGPVHESVMEVRLTPRTDSRQELDWFDLKTNPTAAVFRYADAFGNDVHHFDIVAPHQELFLETRMRVRTSASEVIPERLEPSAWDTLDRLRAAGQLWDFFEPSPRVPISPAVRAFAESCGLGRASDPLTCVRHIVTAVYGSLVYSPESTTVDTPIEAVLDARRGVCQDLAHVTLAVARAHGIPCRYVSGYLAPASDERAGRHLATHAWVEAWLPGLEWTALDPTHDTVIGERHMCVAVGRDYGDAAPTRGVFRGGPAGPLSVSVRIDPSSGPVSTGEMMFPSPVAVPTPPPAVHWDQ
jgi:transglutaminase-like putative cysteine protease